MKPMQRCDSLTTNARPERIGLLAGGGRFPILFARAARQQGMKVVCVGIDGNVDPTLAQDVDLFLRNGVARLGSMIRKFKNEGISRVVMAGKIHKGALFERWRLLRYLPDWRFLRVYFSTTRYDHRDDALLLALVREFERDGIKIASALEVCPELLASAGCLTQRGPRPEEIADIAFGWNMAKEMGRLDIGQSVVVRERVVLAVEAIEGTDRAIERAGVLCPSGGFVVVKVSKPRQDMRFDVPAIGRTTIESMHRAGGTCLAVEAGKTIVIDAEETIDLADRFGITVISLQPDSLSQDPGLPEVENEIERRDQRRPA